MAMLAPITPFVTVGFAVRMSFLRACRGAQSGDRVLDVTYVERAALEAVQ